MILEAIIAALTRNQVIDLLRCKYYLQRNGKEVGPFTCPELVKMVHAGLVERHELIRHDTEPGQWHPVGEYLKHNLDDA